VSAVLLVLHLVQRIAAVRLLQDSNDNGLSNYGLATTRSSSWRSHGSSTWSSSRSLPDDASENSSEEAGTAPDVPLFDVVCVRS